MEQGKTNSRKKNRQIEKWWKKCFERSEEIVDCFDWSSDNGRRETIRRAHYTTELNTDFRRFLFSPSYSSWS